MVKKRWTWSWRGWPYALAGFLLPMMLNAMAGRLNLNLAIQHAIGGLIVLVILGLGRK